MSENNVFTISFPDADAATASRYAKSLQTELFRIDEETSPQVVRENSESMNFGETLQIIVTSGAASAVAAGVASFIRRHSGAKLVIKTDQGTVVGNYLNSQDAAKIAEAFAKFAK